MKNGKQHKMWSTPALGSNWTEILRKAGLESPGYQEAAEATAKAWEEKKARDECRKPKGRRKSGLGRTKFPGLKHGAD